MQFSENEIRSNYAKYRDEDLIRIAEMDADSLSPEALQILKDEIDKRDLQNNLPGKAGFRILDQSTLNLYCSSIQSSFCPACGSHGNLNMIRVSVIGGIGYLHIKKTRYYIL